MTGTPGTSSGAYTFNLSLAELLIDAYQRNQITMAITDVEKVRSGTRSLNLVLVSWANRGVNLWTVQQFTQPMPQGVAQYVVPPQVVDVLADSVILRQYQMGTPVSIAPNFTTTINSASVTVAGLAATPASGQYINVGVAVSVGGLILNGPYQVQSVPGSGQATFNAASNATASVANGGVVPSFTSTANSTTMAVSFPNHGLLTGQPFTVQVATVVGGVTLLGPYAITYVDADHFTITAPYPAGSVQTVSENGGNAYMATQATVQGLTQSAYPVDIVLYPLSRGDYDAIPLKRQEGRPTSYWLNRQVSPVFNVWLVPDQNGPYELRYYASQQVQDAHVSSGETLQVPYRFLESFAADVAAHLSMKWAPQRTQALAAYAAEQWALASDEDRERVSSFFTPDFSSYYSS